MDMFMDKLAQKLTAQEIIRANTAADTEELNRLRNRIAEYNECLTKLQRLIDDGSEKLRAIQAGNAALDGSMEDNIEKVGDSLRQEMSKMMECLDNLNKSVEERLSVSNEPVLTALTGLQAKLQELDGKLEEKTDAMLPERQDDIEESVHKECVKVYRNVQAVVLAESEKQKEAVAASASGTANVGKKVGAVLKVSVAALIFSMFGIALQILGMLGLLPF